MTVIGLIKKYEIELKKLQDFENDYHLEKIKPSANEFYEKMQTKQHISVFINELKKIK